MIRKENLKVKAVALRKSGLSYSEILKKIPVATSTIFLWLREVGLAKRQKQRITEKRLNAMAKGWMSVRNRRIEKTTEIKTIARCEVPQLICDPLWLAGTMLYWAEGSKERTWRTGERVRFSNMDPAMVRIFLQWLKNAYRLRRIAWFLKYTYIKVLMLSERETFGQKR